MIERINHTFSDTGRAHPPSDSPQVVYDMALRNEDPFLDPSLLDSVDANQHEDIREAVDDMIDVAIANGLPPKEAETLKEIVHENLNIFRTSLSSGPATQVPL